MLQFPVCHWGGGVPSPYFGGSNWLHRAALDGVADGSSATISFHVHFPGNGDGVIGLARSDNFGLSQISFTGPGHDLFLFWSRAGVDDGAYEIRSTGINFTEEVWHHVLLSFSGATAHLYIDGINRLGVTALHADTLNFTSDQFVVGALAANGRGGLDGCMQDLHIEFNKFVDFSDAANRALYDRGTLAAGNVIVATNGYTNRNLALPALRRRVIPIGSYMIATEPLAPGVMERLIPNDRVLSDTRRVVLYYRSSPDRRRLLFGGRVALAETDPGTSGPKLHAIMSAIFPELGAARISHSWMGFVAYTFDHLPHLGVHDGLHFAMGYCGTGVAMASWLGHKVALKVLGAPEGVTAFDDLAFQTRPFYRGTPWFLAGAVLYYRLRDHLAR